MAHPFTVREIARQADVSDARVDLVLHGRPGVRSGTARQVQQAIQDSEAQRHQMELEGRRFMIDVVAAAPARFHTMVLRALEDERPFSAAGGLPNTFPSV